VHGDAIWVQDESFLTRNGANLSGFTIIATLILTVGSLFILVSR
jgi:hypothetical protein